MESKVIYEKLIVNEKEISDEKRINAEIELFYKNSFKKEIFCRLFCSFLDTLPLHKLNKSEMLLCEGALTEEELNGMVSMVQEKISGNDGLTKEF